MKRSNRLCVFLRQRFPHQSIGNSCCGDREEAHYRSRNEGQNNEDRAEENYGWIRHNRSKIDFDEGNGECESQRDRKPHCRLAPEARRLSLHTVVLVAVAAHGRSVTESGVFPSSSFRTAPRWLQLSPCPRRNHSSCRDVVGHDCDRPARGIRNGRRNGRPALDVKKVRMKVAGHMSPDEFWRDIDQSCDRMRFGATCSRR